MFLPPLLTGFGPLMDALSVDPQLTLKTGLRMVHFVGLALGVGAATVLDLMVLRFLAKEKVTEENWRIFRFGSRVVTAGLVVLWLTGLGLLAFYAGFDPEKLGNEKVWAKLVIVSILTINGVFLHAVVLPRVERQIGRRLLGGVSWPRRSVFLTAGAVSAVSWCAPLALGALPQLNFVVPMEVILQAYALALLVAVALAHLALLASPAPRSEPGPSRRRAPVMSPAA